MTIIILKDVVVMLDLMVVVEVDITVETIFVVEVADDVMQLIIGLLNIIKLIIIIKVKVNIFKKPPRGTKMISTIDVERNMCRILEHLCKRHKAFIEGKGK